ncbi:PREDICTED: olfactory receptor 1044-like [Mesitornis unicolor]|uniref:olfactory receptor 1044-like n=1 Tax=Mesitornis unicolor TaxID=54374 RepID=UPI0005280EC4|nr:PREDICTED: olfactory receptor 1044-like [Mesitornis unicolor]
MAEDNYTFASEFILLGFTDQEDLQVICFILFLAIYVVTLTGDLGVITLIRLNLCLHTPMYFFLSHLSFLDICYSSTIIPQALLNFLVEKKVISFIRCATQLFSFATCATAECYVLAGMAYDHYMAIFSYLSVLSTVLQIHSTSGWHKAFSTCASHLVSIILYYGSSLFMYLCPSSRHSMEHDKVVSVLYSIAVPMLNPLIYSLRNTEMKNTMWKTKSYSGGVDGVSWPGCTGAAASESPLMFSKSIHGVDPSALARARKFA